MPSPRFSSQSDPTSVTRMANLRPPLTCNVGASPRTGKRPVFCQWLCHLVPRAGRHCDTTKPKVGAGTPHSGFPSNAPARCLVQFAFNREILGIYARTFQSTSIASNRDARKTRSQPLELGSGGRKIQPSVLIVAFRRGRFEIHAFVDRGTRPSGGFATAFEPKARTRTGISTPG